jgi:hypothetical protein
MHVANNMRPMPVDPGAPDVNDIEAHVGIHMAVGAVDRP